jgi:hypothetical protein
MRSLIASFLRKDFRRRRLASGAPRAITSIASLVIMGAGVWAASLTSGQGHDLTLLDRQRPLTDGVTGQRMQGLPPTYGHKDYFTLWSTPPLRQQAKPISNTPRPLVVSSTGSSEFLRWSAVIGENASGPRKFSAAMSLYATRSPSTGVSTATNKISTRRTPTIPPFDVNTNGAGNAWSNAIIVDLPPPGTVVNLSGAFLPPGLTNIVAISAARSHALAIREDGSVAAWGNQVAHDLDLTNVPSRLANVAAICAGDDYSLALQREGTVVSWGNGVCASVPAGLNSVVALAGGSQHCVALRVDGTVVAWGPRASLPAGLSGVKAVAAGEFHTLLLKRDGTVQVFGAPTADIADAPINAVTVMADSAFYALTAEKRLVSFGPNPDPVPAGLSEVIAFSARNSRCLALKSDGTVVAWGNATLPIALTGVDAVAAGALYCLVLTTNPPIPKLSAERSGQNFRLSSPVAVSGYVLQSKDNVAGPWSEFNLPADGFEWEEADHPFLLLPATDATSFFRLKKP